MVSKDRILQCVNNNLQALSCVRGKQENLIGFAEILNFPLKDIERGLSHAIVMGGAIGRGDVWPIGWQEARTFLNTDEVRAIEAAYLKIIDNFPQDLKDSHAIIFA
jgi:hypothetical protein